MRGVSRKRGAACGKRKPEKVETTTACEGKRFGNECTGRKKYEQ